MSDNYPSEAGIYAPTDGRIDPFYLARQLMALPYENFPTQRDFDRWFAEWSALAIPAFDQIPGLPPEMRDWMHSARNSARAMWELGPRLTTRHTISREAVEDWMDRAGITAWLSSMEAGDMMWDMVDSKAKPMQITKFNHGLYAHEDGKLNRIRSKDILELFPPGHEEEWPAQLVLTANHARCRGSDDVYEIMTHFEALGSHALPGKFDLERRPDKPRGSVAGKTIMLAAVHAQDAPPREGAALVYRNHHLLHYESIHERIRPNSDPDELPTKTYPGISRRKALARYDNRIAAPSAVRIGKLMLKLLVEDPSALEQINDTVDQFGERKGFLDDTRTFVDMIGDGLEVPCPMILRADAARVFNRITVEGFSKASTTVNDGKRFDEHEFISRDPQGQPLFMQRMPDGSVQPMDEELVARIVRKLGIIGINGPGVPLTKGEINRGTYRLRLRNMHDGVAGHFDRTNGTTATLNKHDVVHTYDGPRKDFGHDSGDMLGIGDAVGAIMKDPEASRLVGLVYEPKYGINGGNWTDQLKSGDTARKR